MEERGDILFDVMKKMNIDSIKKVMNSATEEISFQAKKEVFDDIEKEFSKPAYLNDKNPYEILQELKKKHLKTNRKSGGS